MSVSILLTYIIGYYNNKKKFFNHFHCTKNIQKLKSMYNKNTYIKPTESFRLKI